MVDRRTAFVLDATSARAIRRSERVQSLWGGYGELLRLHLEGGAHETVILKDVQPRARDGTRSHARKCRSYDVEVAFYRGFAGETSEACRVAKLLAAETGGDRWLLLLEDLDAAGFSRRRTGAVEPCVRWLAAFHATFLGRAPQGLWQTGTYWHLATRPDELARITDRALRDQAPSLDRALSSARFQTLVHGDAKPANFCFSSDGARVAAVDFQYVGGGSGMKDLAYLLHGASRVDRSIDLYFSALRASLADGVDADELEAEWRALYPIATADFERFLAGWRG